MSPLLTRTTGKKKKTPTVCLCADSVVSHTAVPSAPALSSAQPISALEKALALPWSQVISAKVEDEVQHYLVAVLDVPRFEHSRARIAVGIPGF